MIGSPARPTSPEKIDASYFVAVLGRFDDDGTGAEDVAGVRVARANARNRRRTIHRTAAVHELFDFRDVLSSYRGGLTSRPCRVRNR